MALNELGWTKLIWQFLQEQYPEAGLRLGRERQLWDLTRVDILTDGLAIEVDWAPKYAEAVGQSLWYALNTKRQPGIILLSHDFQAESRFLYRCKAICTGHNIEMWLVNTTNREIVIYGDRYTLPQP